MSELKNKNDVDNIDNLAFAFFASLAICSILNDSYTIFNNFLKNNYVKKKLNYCKKIKTVIFGLLFNQYENDKEGNIIIDEKISTNPFDEGNNIGENVEIDEDGEDGEDGEDDEINENVENNEVSILNKNVEVSEVSIENDNEDDNENEKNNIIILKEEIQIISNNLSEKKDNIINSEEEKDNIINSEEKKNISIIDYNDVIQNIKYNDINIIKKDKKNKIDSVKDIFLEQGDVKDNEINSQNILPNNKKNVKRIKELVIKTTNSEKETTKIISKKQNKIEDNKSENKNKKNQKTNQS